MAPPRGSNPRKPARPAPAGQPQTYEEAEDQYLDRLATDGRGHLRAQKWVYDDNGRGSVNRSATVAVAAAVLGISERHYCRLLEAGVLPRYGPGRIDLEHVEMDYHRYLGAYCYGRNPRTGEAFDYNERRHVRC